MKALRSTARVAWASARALSFSITGHWALALFSLVAAFGVWVIIQDVDNPRVEGDAPRNGGIEVEPLNIPDGFLVEDIPAVHVRVEARKADLESLRPGDFKAEVDVKGVDPNADRNIRQVRVESRRSGVRVLSVSPATVDVSLIQASSKDVPVTVRKTSQPPGGFQAGDVTSLDPAFVTIRGAQKLVDTVASVDLDVSLANARDEAFVFEGDLVARTAQGNTVQVSLSQTRAKLTMKIEQLFSLRSLGLVPTLIGSPAPGFIVVNVVVDPPLVQVTGPKAIVDGLRQPLNLEQLDITGARQNITLARSIERPPNVSTDRQTVLVRVEIQPIDCGGAAASAGCQGATFFVAPLFELLPAGLVVDGQYTVAVRISGPLAQVAALKLTDLKVTVSLAGGVAGQSSYQVRVTAPVFVRVEPVDPVTVTLKPAVLP